MKTYGKWTEWIRWLAERYSQQLASLEVQFAVLRDVSSVEEGLEGVRSTEERFGNASAPLCEVTWNIAKQKLSSRLFDDSGRGWEANSHIMTTVYELLWWNDCAPKLPRSDVKFVWFVEHDAFFNGDLARFVQAYADEDADFVARGFRIAGPKWWLYGHFEGFFKKGMKTFGQEDKLVKNVGPLPGISEGKCRQEIDDNRHGLLFAQDHVDRYSARFLNMIGKAAELGMAGPGEGFKPSLCASGIGLGDGEVCSMFDFEPIRTSRLQWISPIYCWEQVQPEPGRKSIWSAEELPCSPDWRDKWVHPVKVDKPTLRSSECPTAPASIQYFSP